MGKRSLSIFNSLSVGIDFKRQNQILTSKVDPVLNYLINQASTTCQWHLYYFKLSGNRIYKYGSSVSSPSNEIGRFGNRAAVVTFAIDITMTYDVVVAFVVDIRQLCTQCTV